MLIVAHAPKGGTGSTFLTAMLTQNLAARGHQVAAVDMTFQDSLKLYFGLLPNQPVIEMTATTSETMMVAGVELLNAHSFSRDPAFAESIGEGFSPLLAKDRITIVDVASDDRALKDFLMPHADLHLCALTACPASAAVLPKVEPGTPAVSLARTAFVLNQLDDRRRLSRHTHSFLRQLLGDRLIGTVRVDEALNEALATFEPLAKAAPSSVLIPDMLRLTIALEARLGIAPETDATSLQNAAV